jgi:hypothetical protein
MLTSAVGPADVSVDRSTLTDQRSTVKGGPRSMGPTGQPRPEADRWAPRVRPDKGKEKVSVWFWAESSDGPAQGPTARLGSRGQLGLRLGRPARAVAGWLVLGRDAPWAAVGWRPSLPSSPLAGPPLFFSLLSDGSVPRVSLRWIWCGGLDLVRQEDGRVCAWAPRRACECGCRKGARGNASTAWPRRERDVAVASQGWTRAARPWRRQGWGAVGSRGTGRTHARGSWQPRAAVWPCRARGTGIPGSRHNAAAVRRRR